MRNFLLTIIAVLFFTMFVWGAAETQQSGPQHQTGMSMTQNCPMKMPGTDLAITDIDDGIALTIRTTTAQVDELRRRILNMVQMHSDSAQGHMRENMMPFSIKYEEIENGARLTLSPKDLSQLDTFRAAVRRHAEQMQKGQCSMMQGMMRGMMNGNSQQEDHSAHHPPDETK